MMSGTFSSIMRAGCCSATLIGRSRWAWRIPLQPRMAPSFRLPTASPGSASSSRRCAGCCPPPSSGLGGTRCSAFAMQGGSRCTSVRPRAEQKLARERWCFPHWAVCCLLCCLPCGERAFRHTALASQWLFFAGAVRLSGIPSKPAQRHGQIPLGHAGAGLLAVGIHPYFLPLVMMCALLAAVELGRQKKAWGRAALQFAASLAAAVVGGILCGAIASGTGASRSGYGDYSMNLNALINPTSAGATLGPGCTR